MKKTTLGGIVLALLLSASAFVVASWPKPIPPEVVARSVIQEPALLAKAENLPSARELVSELQYQSNLSTCGPSSLGNVFRVLGEAATTEEAVLEGSGRCPLGFCVGGLTLDQRQRSHVCTRHEKSPSFRIFRRSSSRRSCSSQIKGTCATSSTFIVSLFLPWEAVITRLSAGTWKRRTSFM